MTRTHSQMHHTDSIHNTIQSFDQFGQMVECSFMNQVVVGSSPVADT